MARNRNFSDIWKQWHKLSIKPYIHWHHICPCTDNGDYLEKNPSSSMNLGTFPWQSYQTASIIWTSKLWRMQLLVCTLGFYGHDINFINHSFIYVFSAVYATWHAGLQRLAGINCPNCYAIVRKNGQCNKLSAITVRTNESLQAISFTSCTPRSCLQVLHGEWKARWTTDGWRVGVRSKMDSWWLKRGSEKQDGQL